MDEQPFENLENPDEEVEIIKSDIGTVKIQKLDPASNSPPLPRGPRRTSQIAQG